MIWSYDDDDRNAAALLEKGVTIYILLRLQGTFDKNVVALEGSNVSDRLSINILPEILWEKLDSQSVSYPMNIIDYFCNVLFLKYLHIISSINLGDWLQNYNATITIFITK